jgi:hypothetical protein
MSIRPSAFLLLLASLPLWVNSSLAGDVLFYRVPRNYGQQGLVGKTLRQELETRMFTQSAWHQRLFCESHDPDINETLETYSRPDGRVWLRHRRADPSISRIIWNRTFIGERFDLRKQLDAVNVATRDIALPPDVARELDVLWTTMLPGLPSAPKPPKLYMHTPTFIAFARKNGSVETGSIAIAAYDTPIYRAFLDVLRELRDLCDRGASSTDPTLTRLPRKIRRLAERLK